MEAAFSGGSAYFGFGLFAIGGLGIALDLIAAAGLLLLGLWAFWRYYWFWRNPERTAPAGDNIVSPADGVVVYVRDVAPDEPAIICKQGRSASINDIVREDLKEPRILVGVFMSPFGVHYNRAPLDSTLESSVQYPAVHKNHHMGSMHFRSVVKRFPIEINSPHIVENNRAVTRFRGRFADRDVSCYVVQIGGGGVHGIDVYPEPGSAVKKGEVFGMIRIGSQVDLIMPRLDGRRVMVKPGDRVVAGETILIG